VPRTSFGLCALIAGLGCAPAPAPRSEPAVSIRFAIQVSGDPTGPLYVALHGSDGAVGWVRASRAGVPVHFRERCDIEDCGAPAAVCGAAIPMVRDIAGGGGPPGVELVWDGTTSVVDSVSRCETRRPAPPGDYVARFCYSREAEVQPGGYPGAARPGRLLNPTCVNRAFGLQDREVVLPVVP
jgi:hypothetical protein